MPVHIMTDSVADLPSTLAKAFDITVVPLSVHIDGESYLDGVEMDSPSFFERLAQSKELPKTSQVTPGAFATAFENALRIHDQVLLITMASSMSGTYQAALSAVDFLETDRVKVVDSKAVTFGFGLIVLKAAELAKKGLPMEALVAEVEKLIDKQKSFFIVDTLSYLTKGGRLTKTEGFVGGLLNIKPILTIKESALAPIGKARGRKKALSWLMEELEKEDVDFQNTTVGFFHAVDKDYLATFEQCFMDKYTPHSVLHAEVGAVVGTHSGPGCVAIAYIPGVTIKNT